MTELVNIIIRTFNEAKWLPICLQQVFAQDYKNFKVTVVDSGSSDLTLEICKNFDVTVCGIEEFMPGDAINIGVRQHPDAEFFVCLSAHCVPTSTRWLTELIRPFKHRSDIAAVTGRQVAMNFTSSDDMRDLFITFPEEEYVSSRAFLHNANSIIRKSCWELCEFDPKLKHIEDLVWAKNIVQKGYKLGYTPNARATHFHGPNQHGTYQSFRSKKLTKILIENELVQCYYLENLIENPETFLKDVFWGSQYEVINEDYEPNEYTIFLKDLPFYDHSLSISHLLHELQKHVRKISPDTHYLHIIGKTAKEYDIVALKQYFWQHFPDSITSVSDDSGNYWILKNNKLELIQYSLELADKKQTVYRSTLTEGSIMSINDLYMGSGTPPKLEPVIILED